MWLQLPPAPHESPRSRDTGAQAAVDPAARKLSKPGFKSESVGRGFMVDFSKQGVRGDCRPRGDGGEGVGRVFRLTFPIMELEQTLPDENVDFNSNNKALAKLTSGKDIIKRFFGGPCRVPSTGEQLRRTILLRLSRTLGLKSFTNKRILIKSIQIYYGGSFPHVWGL